MIPGLGRSLGGEEWQPTRVPAWGSPWTEEPGGLQCLGLQTVRHCRVQRCRNPSAQPRGSHTQPLVTSLVSRQALVPTAGRFPPAASASPSPELISPGLWFLRDCETFLISLFHCVCPLYMYLQMYTYAHHTYVTEYIVHCVLLLVVV